MDSSIPVDSLTTRFPVVIGFPQPPDSVTLYLKFPLVVGIPLIV
jgi:hypothetical protein